MHVPFPVDAVVVIFGPMQWLFGTEANLSLLKNWSGGQKWNETSWKLGTFADDHEDVPPDDVNKESEGRVFKPAEQCACNC